MPQSRLGTSCTQVLHSTTVPPPGLEEMQQEILMYKASVRGRLGPEVLGIQQGLGSWGSLEMKFLTSVHEAFRGRVASGGGDEFQDLA